MPLRLICMHLCHNKDGLFVNGNYLFPKQAVVLDDCNNYKARVISLGWQNDYKFHSKLLWI